MYSRESWFAPKKVPPSRPRVERSSLRGGRAITRGQTMTAVMER